MQNAPTQPQLSTIHVHPVTEPLRGEFQPPGDRRITHRALILGALATGPAQLEGALESAETVATRRVLAQLGVSFSTNEEGWLVISRRGGILHAPDVELDCGRSVGTLRLMAGMLAGQRLDATLTGAPELLMLDCEDLAQALGQMGAQVECAGQSWRPPLRIRARELSPADYQLTEETYTLKDPLLLAGLLTKGTHRLQGLLNGHDHLERLLKQMGVALRRTGEALSMAGQQNIHPRRVKIPGDLSAAAPAFLLATLTPESSLLISHVGTNPGRMRLVKTLMRCGAQIDRLRDWQYSNEPVSSFRVRHTPELDPFNVPPNLAPQLFDEYPLLALLATQAHGVSRLQGATALQHRTPDLLQMTAQILRQFGADIEQEDDGFTVRGPTALSSAEVQCAGDRRLALLAATAALLADGPSVLHGASILEESYPGLLAAFAEG